MSIILLLLQSKTFGQSDKVEEHDSTGKKELSLNGYPYIYYTPETELAFGVGGILVFYSSDSSITLLSKVVLGGYYMLQSYEIGIFLWENDQWQWGIAPEVGVVIPVERDFGLILNGKYNYAFTGETSFDTDINNAYWGINIGFVWEP